MPGRLFRDVLAGGPGSPPPPGVDPFPPASVWLTLPPSTTCFAIIAAEGQWIECYQAESHVLLEETGGRLEPVNPPERLSRMQAKWRSFVAEYSASVPNQVIVPCDATLRAERAVIPSRMADSALWERP